MTLFDFFRLIYRNLRLLTIVPVVMAVIILLMTMNQPKTYRTNALIYTGLASGYNLESGSSDKMDYKQVNAAYDNLLSIINSRYTLEEVGLRLLAFNLIKEKPSSQFGSEAFDLLMEAIPLDTRENLVFPDDEQKTYERLVIEYHNGNKIINQLIRGESSYSIKKFQSIEVKRVKSSDMISLGFESYDPGLCKNSLRIVLEVFTMRYKEMKENETGSVVAYFAKELEKAKLNLNNAEDDLTEFRVQSRVINYGEETKALAIKKQNALEEYALRKMNLKSTEAALEQLEEKLSIRKEQLQYNINLIESKKNLTRLSSEIAMLESNGVADSVLSVKTAEQEKLKSTIQVLMEDMISRESTPEGIPGKQLITDWLDNLIQYNKDLVAVQLFKKRLEDIDTQFDIFTPMGSTIDRMERQISVYEREYLEVLHGLNLARLRAQNIELTSNLDVIDEPQYPLEPEASKRTLLIIMGFMVGFMGTLSFLVAIDLLDNSLKKPEKAAKDSGLELAGAYPIMNKKYRERYPFLTHQLSGLLTSKIKLEKFVSKETHRSLIVIFSVNEGEGKSTITNLIYEDFIQAGEKAILVTPNEDMLEKYEDVVHYKPERSINGIPSLESIVNHDDLNNYKYVLLEIPPLAKGKIPIHIIEQASISLLVSRADKAWSQAHKYMITNYRKITGKKPMLILNGVKLHYLDQVLGELPIPRSTFVKWIRKVVKFEFNRSKLTFNLF